MEIIIGIMIPFLATALGSAFVFFTKKELDKKVMNGFLSFAAGIMVSASIFSLLLPAMEQAESNGDHALLPLSIGFLLGGLFLLCADHLLPHLHPQTNTIEGMKSKMKRTTMLVFAVTLHNVPEGMATGLLFALAMQSQDALLLSSAFALAIGIGLQNVPEGAAVALPLKREGLSNQKAFFYGSLSGLVEPIASLIALVFASFITAYLPWLLSFAAGAMIYVVVEELIPEAHLDEHSHLSTVVFMIGFTMMMILDIALG